MKKAILLFLLPTIAFGQTFIPSNVDTLAGFGNYHPQIEIANDNAPLILWTNQTEKSVLVAKPSGVGFSTPVQLNPAGLQVQSYNWSGPDLATWEDNVYVVFRSHGYETGHIYLVKSIDNGETFGDTVRVDNLATGFGQYPDVAVYNDTVYVTFMDHDAGGSNPQYVVTRSVDGGATFQAEVVAGAIMGDEACDCCQPEIVVNDEYVIVFLRNNENNIRDIKAVISYDRGSTFSSWFSVDDHQWYINSCPSTGPDSRITEDNHVLTTYRTYVNNVAQVYLNEYNVDLDLSVSMLQTSSAVSPNSNYPQLAYANDNLGLVWEGLGQGSDVFFIGSNSGMGGMDTSNTMNLTGMGTQSKPDIAFDGSRFHIVYANTTQLDYLTLEEPTGVLNNVYHQDIVFFPNPTTGDVTVGDFEGWVYIYNGLGLGSKLAISQFGIIDLSSYPRGIYFIKATDVWGRVFSQKVIKE